MTVASPLSERALRFLVARGCMPPGWSRERLDDWLIRHQIPPFASLIAWEQALNDVRERFYLPRSACSATPQGCRQRMSNRLVAFSSYEAWTMKLASGAPPVLERDGATLVRFGSAALGRHLYLDETGHVIELSPPNLSRARMVARTPFIHLEREVLRTITREAPAELRCEGDVAERLADALDVHTLPEASDDLEQINGNDHIIVQQTNPWYATVFLLDVAEAPKLVRVLAELGTRARIHGPAPTLALEPLDAAPPLPTPVAGAVQLWSFGHTRGAISLEADALVQITGRTTEARRLVVAPASPPIEHRRCLLADAALQDFSPRARDYLRAMRARRDPIEIPEGDELEEALARWGLRSYDALRQANATWGGFAWGDEPPNQIGTLALLTAYFPFPEQPLPPRLPGSPRDLGLSWEGRELVMIGATPSTTMYLDHDGTLIEHEATVDQLFPSASSLRHRIEFEAALETVTGQKGQFLEHALPGSIGAPLAHALGLPAVPEASDAIRSWWIGEHVSIQELFAPLSGERMTVVFATDDDQLAHAIQLAEAAEQTRGTDPGG
ncbi:hypothetical protein [Chondromyces crocatus]|uniref:Uncharacterized protein n=1 Tax=Chondromyces crocatus TaxID=52 RepID=A0A0K1EIP6_CHOCO|nr:hypothetical protein [Chondromyces crocatus]AKT40729.1 uncharacterized protein CMC5_048850 [Chondromyces crocatus]